MVVVLLLLVAGKQVLTWLVKNVDVPSRVVLMGKLRVVHDFGMEPLLLVDADAVEVGSSIVSLELKETVGTSVAMDCVADSAVTVTTSMTAMVNVTGLGFVTKIVTGGSLAILPPLWCGNPSFSALANKCRTSKEGAGTHNSNKRSYLHWQWFEAECCGIYPKPSTYAQNIPRNINK